MSLAARHSRRTLIFLILSFVLLLGYGGTHQRVVAQAATAPVPCALTPDILEGLGFNVSTVGLGFNVSTVGLGFNVSTVGLGFNVSTVGLGFNVSTVGLSAVQVATEIVDPANRVGFQWLLDFMEPLYASGLYNSEPVRVIILDNQVHGGAVRSVYEQANTELANRFGVSNIEIVFVDIGGGNRPYDTDIIADSLTSTINDLQAQGIQRYVVNMSWGMLPCETDDLTVGGVTYSFNYPNAIREIETINETVDPDPTLIEPDLLCVTFDESFSDSEEFEGEGEDEGEEGYEFAAKITAHFGYFNPNPVPVFYPYDSVNNFLSGGGFSDDELISNTPNFFYRDSSIPEMGGTSPRYPDSSFQVTFDANEVLSWTLNGKTVSAGIESDACEPAPEPTFFEDVSHFVECVQIINDATYLAHFGVSNTRGVPVHVPQDSNNQLLNADLYSSQAFVPTVIGYLGDHSGGYPNTVLNVLFTPGQGGVTWVLNGIAVTADENSAPCVEPNGYGLQNYLTEFVGIPQDQIAPAINELLNQGAAITDSQLEAVLAGYLDESERQANDGDPNTRFQLVPVASAGNFAAFIAQLTGQSQDQIPPLAPAAWQPTVASAATFGTPFDLWSFGGERFTHIGEVALPGGTFVANGNAVVGTSFAAPNLTRVFAGFLTFPEGCVFIRDGNLVLPPVLNPGVYNNSLLPNGNPLNCAIPVEVIPTTPVCNGLEATIFVDENGMVVGGPDDGRPYNGTLRGTNFADVMVGTAGNDTIRGSNNDDILCGEGGEDRIFGENGFDTIFGGPGNDSRLDGGNGFDVISGDAGDDTLFGSNGNDTLDGGPGNDILASGEGDDTLIGGPDDDTLNAGGGQDTLDGNEGNDTLNGGNGDDTLRGGPGNDILNGDSGQDQLFGDADDDILNGGGGDDRMFGGDGNDELRGGQSNDRLFGEAGTDELFGDNGDDRLEGGPDDDILQGGGNNDTLLGDDGQDVLFGNNGDDNLDGGLGDDLCDGGNNNDRANACETLANIP